MASASTASASLSDDIQRALQQAVGDANNAAASVAKQKKHKRHRDDEHAHAEVEDGGAGRKMKKSKKHNGDVNGDAENTGASASGEQTATPSEPDGAADGASAKKKKKSKGKERAHDVQPQPQIDPALMAGGPHAGPPMDIGASSADFLSAVVAAASATAGSAGQQLPGTFEQQMQQFMAYPQDFEPYPYNGLPPPGHVQGPHAHAQPGPPPFGHPPAQGMFPDPATLLPDLNFASSEDLLRSLQEFDISKVVTVLKTLGEAAAAANVQLNMPPMFAPGPPPPPPPPVQQQPVGSDAIMGRPQKQKKNRGVGPSAAAADAPPAALQPDNPEHAHMLANVWMNAAKLADLVKTEGLVYKKGKFSATEDQQLNDAIERYRVTHGLSQEDLDQIIFSNKSGKDKGHESFWSEITSALHLRPIISVYHHVRRARHPFSGKGSWTKTEDDLLIECMNNMGQQWEKISDVVHRTAADCRDRYRNHLQDRDVRRVGAWTKEEEDELTQIVSEMTVEQGKDIDNDIFWGVVSKKMGGKRGRQQCRIKWTDSLAPQLKNTGERPRWSAMDAYILVHKVDSLNVRDDTEIDWKLLPDENWNVWSAHSLQRRWLTMKRSIKGFEEMSHAEIMEILKTKKAQSPPPSSAGRKKKNKVTSAEAVNDGDEGEGQPEAGGSAGPGTIGGSAE